MLVHQLITHLKVSPMRVISTELVSESVSECRKDNYTFQKIITNMKEGSKISLYKITHCSSSDLVHCTVQDLTLIFFIFASLFCVSSIIIIYNLLNCHFLASTIIIYDNIFIFGELPDRVLTLWEFKNGTIDCCCTALQLSSPDNQLNFEQEI